MEPALLSVTVMGLPDSATATAANDQLESSLPRQGRLR